MKRGSDDAENTPTRGNRLKGKKVRDEFVCPITYEVLRDPVVAMDGHTYEKNAIEKWFKTNHHTSPRNGETMEPVLITNLNLKKLIQDLINEGGHGLYTDDINSRTRLIDVCPQKVLVLKCLGPPETDWNLRSFEVTRSGCIGGRKQQQICDNEMILFRDSTVSRKHFQISYNVESGKYDIRDFGSAGGTYIRIPYGSRKELHPGMMILFGKHQFNVSSIDDSGREETNGPIRAEDLSTPAKSEDRRDSIVSPPLPGSTGASALAAGTQSEKSVRVLKSLASDAERIAADMERNKLQAKEENASGALRSNTGSDIERRLRELASRLSIHVDEATNDHELSMASEEKLGATALMMPQGSKFSKEDGNVTPVQVLPPSSESNLTAVAKALGGIDEDCEEPAQLCNFMARRLVLTCFAPDGSPLQGKNFVVGPSGATIGRRPSNSISLYIKVPDPENGGEKMINIDNAVSAEHACIEFDSNTGQFYLKDGVTKASTNGTWFRLSGPYQESPFYPIEVGMEVLIGTVRFQVSESMTILERTVDENASPRADMK